MDPGRVVVIMEWLIPTTVKEIQSFLSMANFYCRFIHTYSKVTQPLTELMKKSVPKPLMLPMDAVNVFNELKQCFLKAPLLRHFEPTKECTIETDASGFVISAILSQKQDNSHRHPIAFYSRKLNPAEMNYETPNCELLTIVAAFKTWRHYLEGAQHQVTVYSDHSNLQRFNLTKELTRRTA